MGGVPGTSKGCNTCRKRKIRCDEGKPACDRCLRTGRECGGYDRPANFNIRAGATRAKYATKPLSSAAPSHPQVPIQPIDNLHIGDTSFTPSTSPSQYDSQSPLSQFDVSLIPIANFDPITPPPEASSFEHAGDHLINTFLDVYYPSDGSYPRTDVNHSWMQEAANLPSPGKAMPIALRALALSRLGHANSDENMKAQSRTAYVSALCEFQKALWDEHERRKDRTLATGRALTTYELYEATSFRGWNQHQCGFANLLKMRGRASINTHFSRSLLESFRNTMMYQSIGRREDTFLTTDEWRTTPDAEPTQLVNDCGLRIAKLLGDMDAAKADPTTTAQIRTTLLARCVDFDLELDSIYTRQLSDGTPLPLYWDAPAGASFFKEPGQSTGDPHSPLDFRDFNTAQALVNMWALKALVIMNIGALCQSLPYIDMSVLPWDTTTSAAHEIIGLHSPTSTPMGNSTNADPECNIACKVRASQMCHKLAIIITRSAHYFTRIEKGLVGPTKSLFSTRVALMVLTKQGAPEAAWCEKIYESLGNEKGVGFAARLREKDVDHQYRVEKGLEPQMDSRLGWIQASGYDDWPDRFKANV